MSLRPRPIFECVRANQTLPNPVLVDRGGDVHNTAHDCTRIAEHVGVTRSVERYMALIGMKLRSEDGITSFKTACLERKNTTRIRWPI